MTEGKMGEVPDWYVMIRASKYLGVAPWELMESHPAWIAWATVSEAAEARAEKHHHERAMAKAKRK